MSKRFRNYRDLFKGEGANSYSQLYADSSIEHQLSVIERRICRELIKEGIKNRFVHLDFACGTGRIMNFFSDLTELQIGIDVSSDMLGIARNCTKAKLILSENYSEVVDSLNKEDTILISAFRFILNAEPRDVEDFVLFCERILAVTGKCYLLINNHGNKHSLRTLTPGVLSQNGNVLNHKKFQRKLISLNFRVIATREMQLLPSGILRIIPFLIKVEKRVGMCRMFRFGINKIYFGMISK